MGDISIVVQLICRLTMTKHHNEQFVTQGFLFISEYKARVIGARARETPSSHKAAPNQTASLPNTKGIGLNRVQSLDSRLVCA